MSSSDLAEIFKAIDVLIAADEGDYRISEENVLSAVICIRTRYEHLSKSEKEQLSRFWGFISRCLFDL